MLSNVANSSPKFINEWRNNSDYFRSLQFLARLSRLFSDNEVPYLDYRLVENMFCRFYGAENDARSCTAYDAHIGTLGIGIKTFILQSGGSVEKIAEFNKLKRELDGLRGEELARKLGQFRNDRMDFANQAYNINFSMYHIVGRDTNELKFFNTGYDFVNIDAISNVKTTRSGIIFNDGTHEYIPNLI